MPQIKLEVTARRKRILEALCTKNDCPMEALFEGKMIDLECNAAGLDLSESAEDQEAAVDRLERKANRIKTEREARIAAEAAAQPEAPTTTTE